MKLKLRKRLWMVMLVVVACLPVLAFADIIHLNTGGKVEGKIIEKDIDFVKVRTVKGIVNISVDDIESIEERESVFDVYDKKLSEMPKDSADARFELGKWCREQGLEEEAEKHFGEVIALSPNHAGAREALGYVRTADGWERKQELKKEPEAKPGPDKEEKEPAKKVFKKKPRKKKAPRKSKKVFPKREPGKYTGKLQFQGKQEQYVYRIPQKYTGEEPLAFVVLLHGAGDSGDNFLNCVSSASGRDDAIMVAPENGQLPKQAVVELIKKFMKEFNIEKKRIYMFGFSMGGWHTSTVAPFLPKVFAAFVIAGAGNKSTPPAAQRNSPAAGILIGKKDPNYQHSVNAYKYYKKSGYDSKFWEFDGGHEFPGAKLMGEVFEWMFSKKKKK